jgi:hypothetical protein
MYSESQKIIALQSRADMEIGAGEFGWSVALSADGNTALVGTPGDNSSVGSASVFILKGTTWINQHTLYAPATGANMEIGAGRFGNSVALSSDGNTALVGGPLDNPVTPSPSQAIGVGAAWVFNRNDSTWDAGQKLIAPTAGNDMEIGGGEFGNSVALSADGNTALVGAPCDNPVTTITPEQAGAGAAWVFICTDSTWGSGHKLIALASGPNREIGPGQFGTSVALSADGKTALVGTPINKPSTPLGGDAGVGAASVFIRNGTTWVNQHTLRAPTSGADMEIGAGNFGTSVALSSDGNTALVGAPSDNPEEGGSDFIPGVGAAWAFIRTDDTWDGGQKLIAPTSGADEEINTAQLGGSVALSADGNTALIGGSSDNVGGAAWAFDFQRSLTGGHSWVVGQKLTASKSVDFGWSVALSSDGNTALVGSPFSTVDEVKDGGAAWMFETPPPPPPPP